MELIMVSLEGKLINAAVNVKYESCNIPFYI